MPEIAAKLSLSEALAQRVMPRFRVSKQASKDRASYLLAAAHLEMLFAVRAAGK